MRGCAWPATDASPQSCRPARSPSACRRTPASPAAAMPAPTPLAGNPTGPSGCSSSTTTPPSPRTNVLARLIAEAQQYPLAAYVQPRLTGPDDVTTPRRWIPQLRASRPERPGTITTMTEGVVLLGKRHPDSTFAPSTWHLPTGHREQCESALACTAREAAEEAGLTIDESGLHAGTHPGPPRPHQPDSPRATLLRRLPLARRTPRPGAGPTHAVAVVAPGRPARAAGRLHPHRAGRHRPEQAIYADGLAFVNRPAATGDGHGQHHPAVQRITAHPAPFS
ncbi:hypothetical protein SUDANB106_05144 [Streptomyces sp. enrichment culture]